MEGMVIPEGKVNMTPALSETDAIAEAFKYSGRQVSGEFEMIEGRATRATAQSSATRSATTSTT